MLACRLAIARMLQMYKTADQAVIMPKNETFVFLPNGKLLVKYMPHRRIGLPSLDDADAVPYENPVRFVPSSGVDEPGVHGYDVNLSYRELESDAIPDDLREYAAVDPDAVLRELYAAIGKPENREHRDVYRARIRALLRIIKLRKKRMQESQESNVDNGSNALLAETK